MKGNVMRLLFIAHVGLLMPIACAKRILETTVLKLKGKNGETQPDLVLSHALFGRIPSMQSSKESWLTLQNAPATNPLMCVDETSSDGSPQQFPPNTLLLIPRGECPFERKALHAQKLGAQAVLIYETLACHYGMNITSTAVRTLANISFPMNKYDYDCSYGEIKVPADSIALDPQQPKQPYDAITNDGVLTSTKEARCDSGRYFLTGPPTTTGKTYQACCAWDLPLELSPDNSLNDTTTTTIPTAFLTLRQHSQLLDSAPVTVQLLDRWHPTWNASAVLIWLLGVMVATWASHSSASDYHRQKRRLLRSSSSSRNGERQRRSTPRQRPPLPPPQEEEVMDLTAAHVGGFIVSASTSLLVLFYFKIYGIVKVFYAVGCSSALAQVVVYPLLKGRMADTVVWQHEEVGDVTLRDTVAHTIAFAIGIVWLVLAFVSREPERILFFWVMQNVFGACMCCTFLKVIRLNNLKVAALLLIVAFFYDIFFVFITPYLFQGKSVMIDVATSGGPPSLGPVWCTKYPNDPGCQGGNPLPMLLAIPRLFDYRGDSSMLGLGDIVLPGLLLSFAARLDAAKEVIGLRVGRRRSSGQSYTDPCPNESPCRCNGYFGPLVAAYAIGLAMANAAVYWMKMGQPALLYLVPCCLGTMSLIGRRKHELQQLWDGPNWLDENSSNNPEGQHAPLPSSEEEQEAAEVPPSATDLEG